MNNRTAPNTPPTSTDDKVASRAKRTRHDLVFYDLHKSFEANNLIDGERRVIGTDGDQRRLSHLIWTAGRRAVDVLLQITEEQTEAPITLVE